jgi:hypothetical protein
VGRARGAGYCAALPTNLLDQHKGFPCARLGCEARRDLGPKAKCDPTILPSGVRTTRAGLSTVGRDQTIVVVAEIKEGLTTSCATRVPPIIRTAKIAGAVPLSLNLGIPEVGRPLSDQGGQRGQILHLIFFDAGFVLIQF